MKYDCIPGYRTAARGLLERSRIRCRVGFLAGQAGSGGWSRGGVGWGGGVPGTPKNPPKSAIFAKFCAEYSISALKMVKIRKKSVFDIEGFGGFSGPPWGRGRLRKPTRRPAVLIC